MGRVKTTRLSYSFELSGTPHAQEASTALAQPEGAFDVERMKAALASNSHELPVGLGRAERRKRILAVANRQK